MKTSAAYCSVSLVYTMRFVTSAILCLLPSLVYAASSQPICSVESQTYDSMNVTCSITVSKEPQRLEFVARFSGGHDDTSANIRTSLNDELLSCDEGSKLELFGEEGDVSLACRFTVSPEHGTNQQFKAIIHWKHAEYTGYELHGR